MKKVTLSLSLHDLCIFRYSIAQQLKRIKQELDILRITKERDLTAPERWQLPPNINRMSTEELREEIDPWYSMYLQYQFWSDEMEKLNEGE